MPKTGITKRKRGKTALSTQFDNKKIRQVDNFVDFMEGLMKDVVAGRVSPQAVNAACNAGGKMLKAAELSIRSQKLMTGSPVRRLLGT